MKYTSYEDLPRLLMGVWLAQNVNHGLAMLKEK